MPSPIQSRPTVNDFSVIFGDENEKQIEPQIETANLTVDIDQKQILIEVSMSQNVDESQNQTFDVSESKHECDEIKEGTYMTRNSTRLTRSLNNTIAQTGMDATYYKSSDVICIDDSVQTCTTPIAKRLSINHERTPIGKLLIRKVTPHTTESYGNESNVPDDEAYQVIMVNKNQQSQIFEEQSDSLEMLNEYEEVSPTVNNPVKHVNLVIASKRTSHPFPFSPRVILNRINSIDEYNRMTSQPLSSATKATKHNRKPRQQQKMKSKHYKSFIRRSSIFCGYEHSISVDGSLFRL